MKIEIEQLRYDQLIALEKKYDAFIEAMDKLSNEGYKEDDEDWLGNPDFDSESITDLVMKHFDLYGRY